jgi:nickel/cobalt exporter
MTPEIIVLSLSSATIAFVHTVLGPDHYVPFIAMSRARGWAVRKTIGITLACGLGHLLGSILLGLAGISLGIHLASLEWLEGLRSNVAAWMLMGFGLAYLAWGLGKAYRDRPHTHWHSHEGVIHNHVHSHQMEHSHVHDEKKSSRRLAPWVIFVIFVLGPCEPLIPLLMYPAARESAQGVLTVTVVFGLVTVLTMTLVVALAIAGLKSVNLKRFERFGHAIAGTAILFSGLAITFLGM